MNISLEKKKAEAVARMKLLNLDSDLIRQFESEQKIACFEGPLGTVGKLDDEDIDQIRLLEADRDILVYAILFGDFNIGSMASCLYVSDEEDEWEDDRRDIESSNTLGIIAYVFNCTDPELSEFGCVGIDHAETGGLRRVW